MDPQLRTPVGNQLVVPTARGNLALSKEVMAHEQVKKIFADDDDDSESLLANEYRRDAVKLEFWLDFTEKNLQLKYENTNRKSRQHIEFLREKQSMYSACFDELCKQFSSLSKEKTKVLYRVMYGFKDIISSLVEYHILQQDKWQRNVQNVKYHLDLRSGRVEELGEDLQAMRKEFRELDLQLKSKEALLQKFQAKERKKIATREEKMKKIEAEIAFRENLRRSVNGLILINQDLEAGFERGREEEEPEGKDDVMFQQYSGLTGYLTDLYENLMKKLETMGGDIAEGKDIITALLERDIAKDIQWLVEEAQTNTAKKIYMSMKRPTEDKIVATDDYRFTQEHVDHLDSQLMKSIVDRKNLEEETENLQKIIANYKHQIRELEDEVHAKRREIERLNAETAKMSSKLMVQERDLSDLQAQVRDLSNDLKSYVEQNEYLKNLNNNLKAESEQSSKIIADMRATMKTLEGDLAYERAQTHRSGSEGVPDINRARSYSKLPRRSGATSPGGSMLGVPKRNSNQSRLSWAAGMGNHLGFPGMDNSDTLRTPGIVATDRAQTSEVLPDSGTTSHDNSDAESTVTTIIKEVDEEEMKRDDPPTITHAKSEIRIPIPTETRGMGNRQHSESFLPGINRKSSGGSEIANPNIRTGSLPDGTKEGKNPFTAHGLLDVPANMLPQITRSETSQSVSDITSFDKLLTPELLGGLSSHGLGGTSSPHGRIQKMSRGTGMKKTPSHKRTSSTPTALAGMGAVNALSATGAYTPPFKVGLDDLRDINLIASKIKSDPKILAVVNKIRVEHQGRCGQDCICQRLLRAGFWSEKTNKAKVLESKSVDVKFQYVHKSSRK